MKHKSREAKMLAIMIAIIGLTLVIYSLLTGQNANNGYGSMMWTESPTNSFYYGLTNMFLAIVGALMLASGVLYALLHVDYEPVTFPKVAFAPVAHSASEQRPGVDGGVIAKSADPTEVNILPPDASVTESSDAEMVAGLESSDLNAENFLVLRLLTGDERTMFRAITDAGGEALQKDLIVTTKLSEAKVSRVLDRLIEKGVIIKERYGMTNKVRIQIDK